MEGGTLAEIGDLVPKHKFDDSNIEALIKLTDEEILPILPALLEWIQDYNWPVSRKVLPVLACHQTLLIPQILHLLSPEEKDEIWKYWIITCLLPLFSNENILPILPLITRIAETPTQDEKLEEVDEAAILFLRKRRKIP